MYVCVCNAIRECEFRRAARRVTGDAESVYAALGKQPQCGQCLEDAELLLAEERALNRKPVLVAA
ncbi:MAG TPA: (2Fe-2S)-binding protein [Croceibacterium sp.]|nr:(2Fe-2S)-binding protein [Croceibacterium sp.]